MLIYFQMLIAIILGCITAITDFKDKKIYNKSVLVFIGISFFTYITMYKYIEFNYIGKYLLNLLISLIISFLFFYFKIWAAGDAKLFLATVFMIPFELYEAKEMNVFPALWILIMIFSTAFIYVVIETIILWIKDKNKLEKLKIKEFSKEDFLKNIFNYFMGYFIISFFNNIIYKYFEEFAINNGGLLLICNMLFLIFIYRIINKKNIILVITSVFGLANIIYYFINGFELYDIDFKILIIVLAIMLFRNISEQYNYDEISINDLKPRMILSYGSVAKFYSSNVKGLPENTTENTDSRLTEEQVESIKRWSKTKKGTETIIVVRHLPFAPFILCGEIIFFIIKIFI